MTTIHPTATVDRAAELGADVTVSPYAVIEGETRIGAGATIGPHAVIKRYTTLGPGCRVHAHAVLGDLPQDTAFQEAPSYVRIGPDCVVREGVTIHRGTKPETATEVGARCLLMVNSHLGHNVRLGERVIVVNGALLAGYVEVGDGAFISGACLIHQFTRIGRLAMLSGGSGIGKDVPPFCTTAGVAVNVVAGLNVIGMRRAGLSPTARLDVKRAFALLYRSGLNVSQATAAIKAEFTSGPALEFAAFIEQSKRGLCRLGSRAPGAGGDQDGATEA